MGGGLVIPKDSLVAREGFCGQREPRQGFRSWQLEVRLGCTQRQRGRDRSGVAHGAC